MNVKEIIIYVSKLLDLKEVEEYLLDDSVEVSESTLEEIEKLLIAINMINSIIASQYIELIDIVEIDTSANKILYSDISDKTIIEIKEILDSNNIEINYERTSGGIFVDANKLKIKFSYFPKVLTIDDIIDYYTRLNLATFSKGVVGEYLFLKGDYEESYVWNKKFKQSMQSLVTPRRNIITPVKRWM